MTTSRPLRIGGSLALVLALTTASPAGELCVQVMESGWGCFPCDLPIEMDWIGFSTDGPPCTSPGLRANGTDGAPPALGWWNGLITLSASDEDPFANQGLLGADKQIHLWLADAGCGYGFNSVQFAINGDFPLESYTVVAPGTHTWVPHATPQGGWLGLGLPCVGDIGSPTLIGTFQIPRRISVPMPQQVTGVEETTWGAIKGRWQRR